jgi:apolipoprotein N-acyltransferase
LLSSYPVLGLALALAFAAPAHLFYHSQPAPPDWRAESTHFGGVGLDAPTPLADYQAAQCIQQIALRSDARVILFPETVVTNWNPGTDLFWKPTIDTLREQGKTILVGANVFDPTTQHYFNSMVIRGAEQGPNFVQRIPIPIAMWIPLSKTGVPLQLRKPGTIKIAGQNPAILICYEQLLVWPVVTSFVRRPTLLLGTANDYWAENTTIPDIQRACLESWARLFRVPLLWAQNT